MGSKNHDVVPTPLIVQISGLRNGGVHKLLGTLAQRALVAKAPNSKYEGYRMTYSGYDYLAIRALSKRESISSVGNQLGVGKESDIYLATNHQGDELVLKLHRLGRTSFRNIKQKRDYMGKRQSASWMYMSRLSAHKEWAFMKVLREHGFPVPKPIDHSRHAILMEYIDAYPLRQISDVPSPGKLFATLMDLVVQFARVGLIHCDFNEFNILIRRDNGQPVVIDFPQMVSTSHENAEWYFGRDVECIRAFFRRKFQFECDDYPKLTQSATGVKIVGEGFALDLNSTAPLGNKNKTIQDYIKFVNTNVSVDDSDSESEEDEDDDASLPPNQAESSHEIIIKDEPLDDEQLESLLHAALDSTETTLPQMSAMDEGYERQVSPPAPRSRPLSRSPPKSRSPSPDSLEKMMASLDISARRKRVQDAVSSDLSRRAHKSRRNRSTNWAGARGRKGKKDTSNAKPDTSGIWG